ncbi:MAG: hypothetical protein B7X02_00925 [Rhodospirillales bacterium 12-54-5]|nr:MAG: hypothetical protein B7X02_00925 [Rhodospirillales bacterium 12-54-5]
MTPVQQDAVIASLPTAYWNEANESAAKVNGGMATQKLLTPSAVVANDNDAAANDNSGTNWRERIDAQRAAAQGPRTV